MLLQGVLEDVTLNQELVETSRLAVRAFVEDRTDSDGRVSLNALNKFAQLAFAQEPWMATLKVNAITRSGFSARLE